MSITITLSQGTVAELLAALEAAVPITSTPPGGIVPPPPPLSQGGVASLVPPQFAGLQPLVVSLPWSNGYRVFPGNAFKPGVRLMVPFATGQGWSGGILGVAEYGSAPAMRNAALVRNFDGAVVYQTPAPQQEIGINFTSGVPARFSGKVHLDPNTAYTLFVSDADNSVSPSPMIVQLTFN